MATNWTNITTADQVMALANANTGSWFWTVTLYMVWGVLVISMLSFGFEASLFGASFGAFMLGVLLTYMGLVSWTWTAFFMGVIIFLIFFKIFNSPE